MLQSRDFARFQGGQARVSLMPNELYCSDIPDGIVVWRNHLIIRPGWSAICRTEVVSRRLVTTWKRLGSPMQITMDLKKSRIENIGADASGGGDRIQITDEEWVVVLHPADGAKLQLTAIEPAGREVDWALNEGGSEKPSTLSPDLPPGWDSEKNMLWRKLCGGLIMENDQDD